MGYPQSTTRSTTTISRLDLSFFRKGRYPLVCCSFVYVPLKTIVRTTLKSTVNPLLFILNLPSPLFVPTTTTTVTKNYSVDRLVGTSLIQIRLLINYTPSFYGLYSLKVRLLLVYGSRVPPYFSPGTPCPSSRPSFLVSLQCHSFVGPSPLPRPLVRPRYGGCSRPSVLVYTRDSWRFPPMGYLGRNTRRNPEFHRSSKRPQVCLRVTVLGLNFGPELRLGYEIGVIKGRQNRNPSTTKTIPLC